MEEQQTENQDQAVSDGPLYLMLPLLVESGLVEDDSAHYAFTSYPRDIISSAAITVVSDFSTRIHDISLSSMKRIKVVEEYLAVALSLPMKHTDLMTTARNIFRKWLEKPSMFGDVEKQNKYASRIIKHLSLPFAFREPEPEIFKTTFNALINTILNDIKYFHTTHGSWLSKETWILLFNVAIGICDSVLSFDFSSYLQKNDIAKLRQKAVDTFFSIIQLSGLKDDDIWNRFFEYCKKWTTCFDFLRVWGKSLTKLFVFLNLRIYKPGFEPQQQPFQEGVYSAENQISNEMVGFIFHHFVFAIDRDKMTQGAPDLLKEFATNMFQITDTAQALGDVTSDFFVKRFPAAPFLKIFGSFFTFAPLLSESFDEPVSTLVNSIISILSNFQFENDDPIITKLVAYIIRRSTPDHMPPLAMFLNSAYKLYRHNTKILPYISNYALTMIPQLNPAKATRIVNDAFFTTCTSLFLSATETLIHQPDIVPKYQEAFEALWKNTTRSDVQFQLLAYGSHLEIDTVEKLSLYFNENTYKQMTTDSLNILFISALIYLCAVQLRTYPEKVSQSIVKLELVQKIASNVMSTDANRIENYDLLVCAVLQFILNTIEWGIGIYTTESALTTVFQFVEFVHKSFKKFAKAKKGKGKEKDKEKDQCLWIEKNKYFIQSMIDDINGRLNVHFPNKDYFTRRANSSSEICEDTIAQMLGLKDYKTRYFSVLHQILISFIENNDGSGPLVLISRGHHGKAIFIVEEDLKSGSSDVQIADVIKPEPLPKTGPLQKQEPLITSVDDLNLVPVIPDLEADDEQFRTRFAASFDEWLDISKLSYVPSLTERQPYKRPRVIDFITKMGLLMGNDTFNLRIFNDVPSVEAAIKSIDALDNAFFTPVVITHILPTDKSLNVMGLSQRMTPLMSKFLHEIAEPMQINEECAEASHLPKLRSSLPCIPLTRGHIAFISAALVKDEIESTKLKELESYVRIIFNETDFDLKIEAEKKPKDMLLIVRPKSHGLYHVTQIQVPADMYSTFADEQILTAKSLAFNITACIEQYTHSQPNLYPRTNHTKDKIIKDLEKKCGQAPPPATIADAFN